MLVSISDPTVQKALDKASADGGALFPSPADWRETWIYFLLIDRFHNPDHPPKNRPYDAEYSGFQGGTFRGVREKLSYLKDMGVGTLWLSPVQKNAAGDDHAYHGYGIQNFLEIEPRLASDPDHAADELRELVAEAHQLGIYVILDIVLHHTGNAFDYIIDGEIKAQLDWQEEVQEIRWHEDGILPQELHRDEFFTRRGAAESTEHGFHPSGDFSSLKGFDADYDENGQKPVWDILIRAFQYMIAEYDFDGFRIDTLKFISPEFARAFGSKIREFAQSAGKDNFLMFGEIYDSEETISRFLGRDPARDDGTFGIDSAVDYPLFFPLPKVAKGLPGATPADIADVFAKRAGVLQDILQDHGPAGEFFVTFLDNHDQNQRFAYTGRKKRPDQIKLGLGLLFALQGIPCVYYGTEQGLSGHKTRGHMDDSVVREALWGKRRGFDPNSDLYQTIRSLAALRAETPALRYGTQFFRGLSADGVHFDLSHVPAGVLAFSRLLDSDEVLIVANTSPSDPFTGEVLIDRSLHAKGSSWEVLWSSQGEPTAPAPVMAHTRGTIEICEPSGSVTDGPARTLPVSLRPVEIQILAPKRHTHT